MIINPTPWFIHPNDVPAREGTYQVQLSPLYPRSVPEQCMAFYGKCNGQVGFFMRTTKIVDGVPTNRCERLSVIAWRGCYYPRVKILPASLFEDTVSDSLDCGKDESFKLDEVQLKLNLSSVPVGTTARIRILP